jgi:hypothetical protein
MSIWEVKNIIEQHDSYGYSAKVGYGVLRIDGDKGTRQKSDINNTEWSGKDSFLSLYPRIFDYSLGGYYHRERGARTRQCYYYMTIKEGTIYFRVYTQNKILTIASGATPIGSAGRAPDDIFSNIKIMRKTPEDMDSFDTTIGREFYIN